MTSIPSAIKAALLVHTYLLFTLLLPSCESIEEAPSIEIEQQLTASSDTSKALVCPIEISCYHLTDDHIKSLSLKKDYSGLVVLRADYNKGNLVFNKYEIMMARLHHKESEEPLEMSDKELEQLLPTLIEHVEHI